MAFTNLYLSAGLSGASDVNAGSTTTGAAAYTSTSGNWSTVTNQFTPTDGSTPANSIAVGDYVSIYVNAATVTTFVAQVTVVAAGVNGAISVDATIRYGTAPTTNSGARSLKAGGTWNSEIVLAGTGLGTTTVPQSTKINIKGNLTVTTSTLRTVAIAGTTTVALWFSGYNTTPGDLDNDTTNALPKPIWTFPGNGGLITSGAHQTWSSLSVVSNGNGVTWSTSGASIRLVRCRAENTSTASAFSLGGTTALYCWGKVAVASVSDPFGSLSGVLVGCVAENSATAGFEISGGNTATAIACIALNQTGDGFKASTGVWRLSGCTVSNVSGSGVRWTGTPGAGSAVIGCLFRACGGYGVNNASGVNTNIVSRACNDFYSCTQGPENGFGDSPAFFGQTDSADPVTSASNMTPVVGSNARNNGFPGIFENETFSSYADIGAVRHQDPVGGGYAGGVYGA